MITGASVGKLWAVGGMACPVPQLSMAFQYGFCVSKKVPVIEQVLQTFEVLKLFRLMSDSTRALRFERPKGARTSTGSQKKSGILKTGTAVAILLIQKKGRCRPWYYWFFTKESQL